MLSTSIGRPRKSIPLDSLAGNGISATSYIIIIVIIMPLVLVSISPFHRDTPLSL